MGADVVSAIAASVTAIIAGVALWYAKGQVSEARATRKAVAQPNVVVYVEMNSTEWRHLDLVVRNFGQTAAYGVTFEDLPDLDVVPTTNELTGSTDGALYIPESIAVLAPGQEWRTVWDSVTARNEHEVRRTQHPELKLNQLRSVFVGTVRFRDNRGETYTNPIQLDTNTFLDTRKLLDNSDAEGAAQLGRRGSVPVTRAPRRRR